MLNSGNDSKNQKFVNFEFNFWRRNWIKKFMIEYCYRMAGIPSCSHWLYHFIDFIIKQVWK